MMRRFSSSSFTGIRLWEVAVGTDKLASIFSTILAEAPRIGINSPAGFGATSVGAGFAAAAVAASEGLLGAAIVAPAGAVAGPSCLSGIDESPSPSSS